MSGRVVTARDPSKARGGLAEFADASTGEVYRVRMPSPALRSGERERLGIAGTCNVFFAGRMPKAEAMARALVGMVRPFAADGSDSTDEIVFRTATAAEVIAARRCTCRTGN